MTTNTSTEQTAELLADYKEKFNTRHRKEGACYLEVRKIVTIDPSEKNPRHRAHVPVELRLYGTGRTNTACLWINHNDTHRHASGSAGGYGYHRPSAAAQEAIENAGIKLSKRIDGVGDDAIDEALGAIADTLGVTGYAIIRSHA